MLKDITFGQYFPVDSRIHSLDPRIKIILTFAYMILVFLVHTFVGYITLGVFTFLLYLAAHIPIKCLRKNLKPIIPLILITMLLNLFLISDGRLLWHFYIFHITDQAVYFSIVMSLRILLLIAGSSILTYTSLPITLTEAIESLCKPLKKCKIPVHELAMTMSIALRFIPTLIEEADKIIAAQKSRGADFESGNLIKRIRSLTPVFIPLFVISFQRADDLSIAMESRCYHFKSERSHLKQLKLHFSDMIAVFIMLLIYAIIILTNIYPLM